MIMFIAAAIVALFLHRQEVRHQAELASKITSSTPLSPAPLLENILSLTVGAILASAGTRMLWNLINGQPAGVAIDSIPSVAILLGSGLIIGTMGARGLKRLYKTGRERA